MTRRKELRKSSRNHNKVSPPPQQQRVEEDAAVEAADEDEEDVAVVVDVEIVITVTIMTRKTTIKRNRRLRTVPIVRLHHHATKMPPPSTGRKRKRPRQMEAVEDAVGERETNAAAEDVEDEMCHAEEDGAGAEGGLDAVGAEGGMARENMHMVMRMIMKSITNTRKKSTWKAQKRTRLPRKTKMRIKFTEIIPI